MSYITHLNTLPAIPEELIESADVILRKPSPIPFSRPISNELQDWLEQTFGEPVNAFYFTLGALNNGLAPHKDQHAPERGYNYIFQTGGNNVVTTVYDSDLNVLEAQSIPANQWHTLTTNEWHSVHGIDLDKIRILLTVRLIKDMKPDVPYMFYPGINQKVWLMEKLVESPESLLGLFSVSKIGGPRG